MENIQEIFEGIIGLHAWKVQNGYGTFVTLEFGAVSLNIREPIIVKNPVPDKVRNSLQRRLITIRGDFRLFIQFCDWELKTKFVEATSQSESEDIAYALTQLDGQILEKVTLEEDKKECYFHFDLGAVLTTMPSKSVPEGDHWTVFYRAERKNISYKYNGEFATEYSNQIVI